MGQYKPMPKMKTTEPSVELKLKKGGKVKKMMDGGVPMSVDAQAMRRSPRIAQAVPVRPMRAPMMRAKGGMAEAEKAELKRVEKELKQHEGMKASKAHKGLKIGGLAGGIEATRADKKKSTGNIEVSKYKKGGCATGGMAVAKKYETKMNDASRMKSIKGGTGGVSDTTAGGRPAGFKKGGCATGGMAIANKYQTKINDASSKKSMKGATGSIEGSKFKSGGHVAMTCKAEGGYTAMKKMAKC